MDWLPNNFDRTDPITLAQVTEADDPVFILQNAFDPTTSQWRNHPPQIYARSSLVNLHAHENAQNRLLRSPYTRNPFDLTTNVMSAAARPQLTNKMARDMLCRTRRKLYLQSMMEFDKALALSILEYELAYRNFLRRCPAYIARHALPPYFVYEGDVLLQAPEQRLSAMIHELRTNPQGVQVDRQYGLGLGRFEFVAQGGAFNLIVLYLA